MRVSQAEKLNTHQRIIATAKQLFKSNGVEKTSVVQIMQAAGLTHGGFYRHFKDKNQLIEVAIQSSFDEVREDLQAGFKRKSTTKTLDEYNALYLSKKHLENPQFGCPIPSLASEVAKEGDEFKEAFGLGFQGLIEQLKLGFMGTEPEMEAQAIRQISMMAGAVLIARASDAKTAKKVLAACKA